MFSCFQRVIPGFQNTEGPGIRRFFRQQPSLRLLSAQANLFAAESKENDILVQCLYDLIDIPPFEINALHILYKP